MAWLDPAVAERVLRVYRAGRPRRPLDPPGLDELTPREMEVLKLIARGLTNDEIGVDLFSSARRLSRRTSTGCSASLASGTGAGDRPGHERGLA